MNTRNDIKTKLIGLFTLLLALWSLIYFIPETFVLLFNTLLGNLMLIIAIILVYMTNRIYGIIGGIVLFIVYRFSRLLTTTERFTSDSQSQFLQIQNTINKQSHFDMNVIGQQATQQELDYFNEHGMWYWSPDVIHIYEDAVNHNPYIRTIPEQSTNHARTIYNQHAIIRILANQSKEGQFLLTGVSLSPSLSSPPSPSSGIGTFSHNSTAGSDVIKCNMSTNQLERTHHGEKTTEVDYTQLESIIPGFSFLNEPCNPCNALSETPDYSCAYNLKLKHRDTPSRIWNYLWGL